MSSKHELIPSVWTDRDITAHLEECPHKVDVTEFGDSEPREMCCCGEARRHTPEAVARAELDMLTTEVER